MRKSTEALDQPGNFSELYRRHFDKIYRYIYYKTYHRESAEDLTAKTFLKAYEHKHRFNPGKGSYSAWLYRIARNTVIDHFRTKRHSESPLDAGEADAGVDVQVDAENRELLAEARRLLQTLTPKQREIVILRLWEDMSYKQISGVVKMSEAACKMSFSRSMSRLRSAMTAVAALIVLLAPAIGGLSGVREEYRSKP